MGGNVAETIFNNGLKVLTREIHHAPVVTFWVWYRVGSRHEVSGNTGVSHWVEHMMFKGTPQVAKGGVWRLVSRSGGINNAFTSMDFTTYFETLPSDRLNMAICIESDRMVNAIFDAEEVKLERTVIISEREGGENYPMFWLAEEVHAAAFRVHPYHHDVVGWKTDLEHITRDDLYRHYRKYYIPNNAVVVVAGDFETNRLIDTLQESFGAIPRGPELALVSSPEPQQVGERRVVVRRPAPMSYFLAAYHGPSTNDADFAPCYVLSAVLGGASSLTMAHASPGRSSRLYRALVENELAIGVSFSCEPMLDPFLLEVGVAVRPGVSNRDIEETVFRELEKLATKPISDAELAKVLKQTRAQYVYAEDGVMNHGYRLGLLEIVASHQLYDTFLETVGQVTKEDVRRVANKYLTATNRTAGWLIPSGPEGKSSHRVRRTL